MAATLFLVAKSSFQSRFRESFLELGISQSQFARDVGMSRANVTHWMSGRGKVPTADLADKAATRLGVNLAWLLREQGPKRPNTAAEAHSRYVLETTVEIDGVELTKAAIEVARAFMDLPRNRRDELQRQIVTEALQHSGRVDDSRLAHLAAPNKKKRVPGTS